MFQLSLPWELGCMWHLWFCARTWEKLHLKHSKRSVSFLHVWLYFLCMVISVRGKINSSDYFVVAGGGQVFLVHKLEKWGLLTLACVHVLGAQWMRLSLNKHMVNYWILRWRVRQDGRGADKQPFPWDFLLLLTYLASFVYKTYRNLNTQVGIKNSSLLKMCFSAQHQDLSFKNITSSGVTY